MNIATITLFCKERFRIEKWIEYYKEYKEDIYLHVIVNNGDVEDTDYLKSLFPESLVLYCPTNNLVASYNWGLKEILNHQEIDAIAQITNDIKLSDKGLSELYNFLYSNPKYGMVSPILFEKDSFIINQYGSTIDMQIMSFNHNLQGFHLSDVKQTVMECSGLPAGINLAKREIYEKVGLQDENIIMYCDETDIDIRIAKEGYLLAVTSDVHAWHQHTFAPGKQVRNNYAAYYMGRNHIYIARKYFGGKILLQTILHYVQKSVCFLCACVVHHKSKEEFLYNWYFFKGVWAGIRNNQKPFELTHENRK